ncbi:MAG: type VI secretion system baseplate subunit TssK [Ignavibacteriota bacterium]
MAATTCSPSPAAWWKFCRPRAARSPGSRRQKNQSLADFTASDIAQFWLLYTINTAFPTISHLF